MLTFPPFPSPLLDHQPRRPPKPPDYFTYLTLPSPKYAVDQSTQHLPLNQPYHLHIFPMIDLLSPHEAPPWQDVRLTHIPRCPSKSPDNPPTTYPSREQSCDESNKVPGARGQDFFPSWACEWMETEGTVVAIAKLSMKLVYEQKCLWNNSASSLDNSLV